MSNIAEEIDAFSPSDGNWLGLDRAVSTLNDIDDEIIAACLRVFERYPEDDGAGVFFTIIHTLEHFGGYESALASSVRRNPNQWNLLMLNRMLDADIDAAGDYTIFELLMNVQKGDSLPLKLRELAKDYLG